MLTFDYVYRAPLAKMKAAADDWSEMKGKLDKLAEDARTTMAAKAKDDYWRGLNAEVTKPFVAKTAKEFEDAAKAAGGIHRILDDAYEAFRKAQDELKRIVDTEAPAQGLFVAADGRVESRQSVLGTRERVDARNPDVHVLVDQERAAIDAMRRRIAAVVETCDDADVACSNALKANITTDKHNFSAPEYGSLDAEEAHRALELAKKGRDLSHAELERLNELLKDNHASKDFSRTFYNGLGPKGALEFFGQLSSDTYRYAELDKERLADVQALQRNLGLNLAAVTQSGDKWTESWSTEMRRLGTERIPLARNDYNGPFGYQLLGGILRYGDYDPKFLTPIAEHVTQLHAKDPHMFAGGGTAGGWQKNPFNPSGINGAGHDPVVAVLEALGHSPEAAKQFFSAEPTSYDKDGTVGGTLDLDPKAEGQQTRSYLEYFTDEKYESFPDITGHRPDDAKKAAEYLPDALGHALEAATTGHAWDDPNPVLRRDADSAALMNDVMDTYGGDSELRERHKPMIDSLGRMGAAYIDDLNYSMHNFGGTAEVVDRDALFPGSSDKSPRTDFGQATTLKFMAAVAGDEDAYKSLSAAQQVFEASGIKALSDKHDDAIAFAHNATKVHGILDESRVIQISDDFKSDETKRNLELEKQAEWRKTAVSGGIATVVGVGSAVVLGPAAGLVAMTVVPIVMDSAASGVNTTYATDTLQYLQDNEYKNDDAAMDAVLATQLSGQSSAMVPLVNYVESTGMPMAERRELFRDAEDSYNRGVLAVSGKTKVS
ncbi:hypothetical protein [Streptomyces sp. NPDC058579]|uniref:hypothetical protein n=1 Tax=Streptomyces sp. NPDC058579 TaxID=3346548 RepID=UPI0036505DB0